MSPKPNRLSTSKPPKQKQCTPNILPCHIHHSGPIKISKRHWTPQPSSGATGTQIAHFRGRKLHGRKVKLPKGYEGRFVRCVEKTLPPSTSAGQLGEGYEGEEEEEEEKEEAVKVLEGDAIFDHLVVWGHDVLPAAHDAFVKGVEEWIGFAGMINSGSRSGVEGEE